MRFVKCIPAIAAAALMVAIGGCSSGNKSDKKSEDSKKGNAQGKAEKKGKQSPPKTAKGFKSPQEVFEAAKKAFAEKNYAKIADCLTPESRKEFAGMMAVMGSFIQELSMAFLPPDPKKREEAKKQIMAKLKPINDVLEKYKIDTKELGKLLGEMQQAKGKDGKPDGAKIREILAKAGGSLSDPKGFVGDFLAAAEKLGQKSEIGPIAANAKLVDLKVEGDRATATVETGKKKEPIAFVKTENGWLISIPDEAFSQGLTAMPGGSGPGPSLPPPPPPGKN